MQQKGREFRDGKSAFFLKREVVSYPKERGFLEPQNIAALGYVKSSKGRHKSNLPKSCSSSLAAPTFLLLLFYFLENIQPANANFS